MATARQRGAKRPEEDAEKPKRARRRLRGRLESLPNMPVDILVEIMMYLTTPDILHLARTTKTFRAFLMSRTANHIWRAARMNVPELPDCPEHLSEPAYAHLAFDAFCHECLKPNVTTVFWALGVRYCPSCRGKLLVKCVTPYYSCTLISRSIAPLALGELRGTHYRKNHWHLPQEWAYTARQEFDRMSKEERQRHVERVNALSKWARACESWQAGIARSRGKDLNECRSRRLQAVVAKLSALGWADELAHMAPRYTALANHASLREAKDLTERIWQKIQDGVVEHMEGIRRQRLIREREVLLRRRCAIFGQVYRNWHKTQTDKSSLPRPIDLIFRHEELRELVDKPDDIAVSAEDFKLFEYHFPAWAASWAEDCKTQLRQIIRHAPEFEGKIRDGVDPLSLASAAFSCKECETRVPALFPDVLQHECLWQRMYRRTDPVECAAIEATTNGRMFSTHGPWSCNDLHIGQAHQWLAEVIKTCGQDPMTVTREEMDVLDPRLYCTTCEEDCKGKSRRIFTWSNTLAHCCFHANMDDMEGFWIGTSHAAWRAVTDPDELELARKLGAQVEELCNNDDKSAAKVQGYHCYHCSSSVMNRIEVMAHLKNKHGVANDDVRPVDYYLTPGALFSLERPVVLYPPSALELGTLDEDQRKAIELGRAGIYDFDTPAHAKVDPNDREW